jgi:hypothetical protein
VAFVWAFLQYHLLSPSRPTFFLSSGWIPSSYNHSLLLPSPHISVLVESHINCNITTRYVRASLVRVEPTTRHHKTRPETEKWNIQEYKVFSNTFLLSEIYHQSDSSAILNPTTCLPNSAIIPMATLQPRQPLGGINNTRLQALGSMKNRQNGMAVQLTNNYSHNGSQYYPK